MTCATRRSSDPSTELSWFSSTSERRNNWRNWRNREMENFVERRWFRGLLTFFNSGTLLQQTGRPAGRIRLDTFSLSHVTYTRDTTHRSLVVVGHALGEHLLPEARRLRVLLLQSVFFNIADWQALLTKHDINRIAHTMIRINLPSWQPGLGSICCCGRAWRPARRTGPSGPRGRYRRCRRGRRGVPCGLRVQSGDGGGVSDVGLRCGGT